MSSSTVASASTSAGDSVVAPPPAALTSEEQASTLKRHDVIREILLEISRRGITSMDFTDVVVDFIFSGEYRYTFRNLIIKKLFVGDTMLSEAEAEDYSVLSTLVRLSHLSNNNEQLKERIGNLINVNGEAFGCLFPEFREVIQHNPDLQGFTLITTKDVVGNDKIVLKVPEFDRIPNSGNKPSQLKSITEFRTVMQERRRKRKTVEQQLPVPSNPDVEIVNKRRKIAVAKPSSNTVLVTKASSSSKAPAVQKKKTVSSSGQRTLQLVPTTAVNGNNNNGDKNDYVYNPAQAEQMWAAASVEEKLEYLNTVSNKNDNAVRCEIWRAKDRKDLHKYATMLQYAWDTKRGRQWKGKGRA